MHAGAFGTAIPVKHFENFVQHTNELLKNITYEDVIFVDFSFNGSCNSGLILELNQYKYMYGQGFSEPMIAIYNLCINSSNCTIMGAKSDTIKIIDTNGVSYMLFRQNEETVDKFKELIRNGAFLINLVGKGNINEWNGRITEQLFIDSFEIISKPVF